MKTTLEIFFATALIFLALIPNWAESRNSNTLLSRRKRYLVFPEGASMSIAFCMTAQTIISSGIWSQGINWGIAYDLPNETSAFQKILKPKHVMQRRHRRDLYNKMELIMDSLRLDGRSCIYRALCETSQRLKPKGNSIIEEIFRIVFNFPQQKILNSEPDDHRLYHWAYRRGKENPDKECSEMFPACSISLLDLALGYYSDYNEEFSDENLITNELAG